MKPTHFGVKSLLFFTAITGAFFAAPYVNLYFLLLAFFGAHWVLCAWWTFTNLRGLDVSIEEPAPVQAGSTSAICWSVKGDRRRFDLVLRVEFEGGACAVGELAFSGVDARPTLRLPALSRGVYRAQRVTVSSTFPFGLLRRTVRLAAEPVVHVYPEPTVEEAGSVRCDDAAAEEASGHVGPRGRTQPAGLRPRVEGEALRDIHWRASARRGSLVVNEWESDGSEERAVALDRRCHGAAFERRLSAAAGAVTEAMRTGTGLRLVSQGLDETYSGGGPHWTEALRFLAGAKELPESAQGLGDERVRTEGVRVA